MNFNLPPVVKNLLLINLVVFLAQTLLPIGEDITSMLGLHNWRNEDFMPHQFVTNIFLHGGFSHLFTNMFALFMFGRILEYDLGSQRFLTFYMVTGIGAGLFNMLVGELEYQSVASSVEAFIASPTPNSFSMLVADRFDGAELSQSFMDSWRAMPENSAYIAEAVRGANELLTFSLNTLTIGASGAVFGVLLAFGLMHPNDVIMLLIPPIPIKAKYFVMIYGAIELFMGVTGTMSSIAHFAHIGGMLWGIILLLWWKKRHKIFF